MSDTSQSRGVMSSGLNYETLLEGSIQGDMLFHYKGSLAQRLYCCLSYGVNQCLGSIPEVANFRLRPSFLLMDEVEKAHDGMGEESGDERIRADGHPDVYDVVVNRTTTPQYDLRNSTRSFFNKLPFHAFSTSERSFHSVDVIVTNPFYSLRHLNCDSRSCTITLTPKRKVRSWFRRI
ncbi:hypothetical protein BJ165DRAFT_1568675 [Panaeolus papilionaceus]|nr:hypothetical protein BJ165DRAFT_1568675 [Panaeolus papilionaceus]